MERLTERNPAWIDDELWESACEPDCEEVDAVYRRLKEYEDLEEQGRLFKLPCKVGDTIWYVDEDDDEYPIELEIESISKDDNYTYYYANDDNYGKFGFIDSDFCETVFFTKLEAEAKLKELRGKEDD